ncbi:hypothetical protein BDW59DRAFT_50435 [Aspergillus cavernicola]|uniref:Uncharacterized protein n=1 Tax=Aspergillus cavernicola TaxID=176166 RepID=A0ABR4ILF6_9EURO
MNIHVNHIEYYLVWSIVSTKVTIMLLSKSLSLFQVVVHGQCDILPYLETALSKQSRYRSCCCFFWGFFFSFPPFVWAS